MQNPFEYDAAPNLPPVSLVNWFIQDYNFSRFLESSRNVLINGERGSGKSMALIYNSLPYQKIRHEVKGEDFPPSAIGIYIPCNTPLTFKKEHLLLEKTESAVVSEYFLISGIGIAIACCFLSAESLLTNEDKNNLLKEFSYIQKETANDDSPFRFLKNSFYKKLRDVQEALNAFNISCLNINLNAFYDTIVPILDAIKQTKAFRKSHLSLMFDDAHDLNVHQRELLNSWLGYRDHSVFSLKVAIAGIKYYDLRTPYGGTLLEGHDFITLDLEKSYQNENSDFGKFAKNVIGTRLKGVGITATPEQFFPESSRFVSDLKKYEEATREEAIGKGITSRKAVNDYIYKYARARYFQGRPSKANKPTYAGFNTLVHLSTGVVRNLLDPCYWMFDDLLSKGAGVSSKVTPTIQSKIIHSRSAELWEFIRDRLAVRVEGCGESEAKQLKNLFEMLAQYFRARLLNHSSEPRVITFSISAYTDELQKKLDPVLRLAQKAQLLYIRSGPAKDGGLREDFFIPNRMLWPAIGLDVVGQHGRASIKAIHLWQATKGVEIPVAYEERDEVFEPYQLEIK